MSLFILCFLLLSACSPSSIDDTSDSLSHNSETSEKQSAEPIKIHSAFDFTNDNLGNRLKGLPPEALAEPQRFLDLASGMLSVPAEYLLPVDPDRPLSSDFMPKKPTRLDTLEGSPITRGIQKLDAPVAAELIRLTRAAAKDNIRLMVTSSYRSWDYQKRVFQWHVQQYGESEAQTMSMPPGASQHQLGTTVDFGVTELNEDGTEPIGQGWRFLQSGEPAEIWLKNNAGKYGWSLSYPEERNEEDGVIHEPWHWRWIGADAVVMQDDFFSGDQAGLLDFWAENVEELNEACIERK